MSSTFQVHKDLLTHVNGDPLEIFIQGNIVDCSALGELIVAAGGKCHHGQDCEHKFKSCISLYSDLIHLTIVDVSLS